MSAKRTCISLPAALALLLLGCSACADRTVEDPQAEKGRGARPAPAASVAPLDAESFANLKRQIGGPVTEPITEDWEFVTGEADGQNRYLATVAIVAVPPSADRAFSFCSGVLVAPRLVLTAGNCVCSRRKDSGAGGEEQTLIDATSCAAKATVTTAAYEMPTAAEQGFDSTTREYAGEVRPHPALKIVLDKQDNIVSSEADLAIVVVNAPPLGNLPPMELAEAELRPNESLVMVAYSHFAAKAPSGWKRRFREFHVTKILDGGARALFDQPKRHIYKGDSGGPCIRETTRGMVLAGIMNRSLGAEASFTSTYHYRDWIRQEMQRVAGASPSPR